MGGINIKSFNRLSIPRRTGAVGAVPRLIYGRSVGIFVARVPAQAGDVSVMIQNVSAFDVQLSTDPTAPDGFLLLAGHAVTYDISGIEWDGGIYCVVDDGGGNANFCVSVAGGK